MAKGRKRRLFVAFAAPATLVVAWKLGVLGFLRNPAAMESYVAVHPALGALAYLSAYTFISAFGVPGVFFLLPSALVFPKLEAFALGMIGSMTSSWLAFAITRTTLRTFIEPRVPKRLRTWDSRIGENQLATVVTARLTFFLLPPVSWALGLTKVRTGPYLLGTALGILPGVAFCIFVGGSFLDWLRMQPWWMWAGFFGAVALVLLVRYLRDRDDEDEGEANSDT